MPLHPELRRHLADIGVSEALLTATDTWVGTGSGPDANWQQERLIDASRDTVSRFELMDQETFESMVAAEQQGFGGLEPAAYNMAIHQLSGALFALNLYRRVSEEPITPDQIADVIELVAEVVESD